MYYSNTLYTNSYRETIFETYCTTLLSKLTILLNLNKRCFSFVIFLWTILHLSFLFRHDIVLLFFLYNRSTCHRSEFYSVVAIYIHFSFGIIIFCHNLPRAEISANAKKERKKFYFQNFDVCLLVLFFCLFIFSLSYMWQCLNYFTLYNSTSKKSPIANG